MTKRFYLAFTRTNSSGSIGGNSGFSIWPKDTSAQESEIDRPNFQLVNDRNYYIYSFITVDKVFILSYKWPQ